MPVINLKIVVPAIAMPSEIPERWATDLKYAKNVIYERATTKIPDIQAYREILAYLSYTKWSNFVNPNFPKAQYIIIKQRVKVLYGGLFWHKNFYAAMVYPGYFDTRVDNAKQKYATYAAEVLRINRPRYLGWGVAEIFALGLTGDLRAKLYLDKMKQDPAFSGLITDNGFEPDLYIKPEKATIDRPQIIDIITAAVVFGQFARVGTGSIDVANAVMDDYEAILREIIDTDKNVGVTVNAVDLGWDATYDRPYVYIYVTKS